MGGPVAGEFFAFTKRTHYSDVDFGVEFEFADFVELPGGEDDEVEEGAFYGAGGAVRVLVVAAEVFVLLAEGWGYGVF